MQITKDILERYVKEGWLISQVHPTLPLTVYNYSQSTQYEQHWDEVTLQCRGLVMDDNGNIVARPFRKFFNIEENKHTATESFEVYEKMDGSLGIMFFYEGEWIFASRGSFTSEQALKFKEIFMNKYKTSHLTITNTYLFEIIYPTNRIVVDYGEMEDVILLGEIHTESGEELNMEYWENSIFNVVKKYGFKDYTEIQKLNWENKEGFIVRFSNGDRCKIKFADYVKLHRVLTNCSSYDIWENLKTFGKLPEEFLKDVPDEFFDWVVGVQSDLWWKHEMTFVMYNSLLQDTLSKLGENPTKKEVALAIQSIIDVDYGLLFALYNNKTNKVDEIIWKMIKPEYEKPFKN
jgi:hypothetical protein